jgi:hypothetical protein
MKAAELFMSLAGTGLVVCLCILLFARRFDREFRFFTLCMVLSVASTVALIAVRNHLSLYFVIYWPIQALGLITAFLALQEAFHLVFRNFYAMAWFRGLFPGVGILMILLAIIRAAFYPVSEIGLVGATIISLEIAVGLLQVGIFALFIVLVRFFHMRWRQHAFGVVLGFGISAAGELVVYLLRSEFGTKFNPVVRITPPLAYIAAVIIWLVTFLRKEPGQVIYDKTLALTPEQMILELRRYTRAVKGILGR